MSVPRPRAVPERAGARPARQAYGLLGAIILLWGLNWPVMKLGLGYIPPMWFAAARLALGAATLFAILAAAGRLRWPGRRDLPVLVSVAVLQMIVFLACVNTGLLYVDAGRAAILAYTTPLWVTPAAVLVLGERLTARKGAGLALGLCGVVALFNPMVFDWSQPEVVLGNGLLMLGALAWAGAIVHTRAHRWRGTPLDLAPWQMALAAPVMAVLALAFEPAARIDWSPELALVLAYNGPVATAFCFWAVVTVQRSLPTISTSLGLLGVPTAGLLLSAAWLGEPLSADRVLGLTLILAGMALVNLAEIGRGRAE